MTASTPLNRKAYQVARNGLLLASRPSALYCIHLSAKNDVPSRRRHVSTRTLSTATAPTGEVPKLGSLPLTWKHSGWTEKMLLEVVPSHRKPRTLGDKFAWKLTRVCRWGMDFFTRMGPLQRVDSKNPTTAVIAQKPLTESQWLIRFIFLESIAGVPGMVAGTLRHLHSIRRFRPDHGWIKTLLEESYNERMHLLTFLEMYQPGGLMRFMVFAAQGIFYNAMFISYLISPKVCHRFVGYLEEEAVHTYTRCLKEIDDGSIPGWVEPGFKIPEVAVQYWSMREGKRTMRDLILYIRADEASHRGVNHTLGNLDQVADPNPFLETDGGMPQPMNPKQVAVIRPGGLEREELFKSRS